MMNVAACGCWFGGWWWVRKLRVLVEIARSWLVEISVAGNFYFGRFSWPSSPSPAQVHDCVRRARLSVGRLVLTTSNSSDRLLNSCQRPSPGDPLGPLGDGSDTTRPATAAPCLFFQPTTTPTGSASVPTRPASSAIAEEYASLQPLAPPETTTDRIETMQLPAWIHALSAMRTGKHCLFSGS